MDLSPEGLKFIKQSEGCSLHPYLDACGHLTIGYGHLILPEQMAAYRNGIDMITAERLLKADLKSVVAIVNHTAENLNQDQFDALVSFVFNIGQAAYLRSTLLRDLQSGKLNLVPDEMMRWIHNDYGKIVVGLMNRRAAECKIWKGARFRNHVLDAYQFVRRGKSV